MLDSILSVLLAGFALSATPGPSMLYVLSHTVGHGRRAGLASAVGLCVGGMILAFATAIGLATVFSHYNWLVPALSIAGAGYLTFLGIKMILSSMSAAKPNLEMTQVHSIPTRRIVLQGIVVEVLNPKTVLFFALFLPPFLDPISPQNAGGPIHLQLLILGLLVPLTAMPSDLLVAYLGDKLVKSTDRYLAFSKWSARVGGLILMGIAFSLQLTLHQ